MILGEAQPVALLAACCEPAGHVPYGSPSVTVSPIRHRSSAHSLAEDIISALPINSMFGRRRSSAARPPGDLSDPGASSSSASPPLGTSNGVGTVNSNGAAVNGSSAFGRGRKTSTTKSKILAVATAATGKGKKAARAQEEGAALPSSPKSPVYEMGMIAGAVSVPVLGASTREPHGRSRVLSRPSNDFVRPPSAIDEDPLGSPPRTPIVGDMRDTDDDGQQSYFSPRSSRPLSADGRDRTPSPSLGFPRISSEGPDVNGSPSPMDVARRRAEALAKLTSTRRASSPDLRNLPIDPSRTPHDPPHSPTPAAKTPARQFPAQSNGRDHSPPSSINTTSSLLSSASRIRAVRRTRTVSASAVSLPTTATSRSSYVLASKAGREGPGSTMIAQREMRLAKAFLTKELGAHQLQRRPQGASPKETWTEEQSEAKELWAALSDGYLLCKLINNLSPNAIRNIDRRDNLPSVRLANINNFLEAAAALYSITSEDLFHPTDLFEGRPKGFERVVHTILVIQARAPAIHPMDDSDAFSSSSRVQPAPLKPSLSYANRRSLPVSSPISASPSPLRRVSGDSPEFEQKPFSSPFSDSDTDSTFHKQHSRRPRDITPRRSHSSQEIERRSSFGYPSSSSNAAGSDSSEQVRKPSGNRVYSDWKMNDSMIEIMQSVDEREEALLARRPKPSPSPTPPSSKPAPAAIGLGLPPAAMAMRRSQSSRRHKSIDNPSILLDQSALTPPLNDSRSLTASPTSTSPPVQLASLARRNSGPTVIKPLRSKVSPASPLSSPGSPGSPNADTMYASRRDPLHATRVRQEAQVQARAREERNSIVFAQDSRPFAGTSLPKNGVRQNHDEDHDVAREHEDEDSEQERATPVPPIPFPRAMKRSISEMHHHPTASPHLGVTPTPRQKHKRWNSELYLDLPNQGQRGKEREAMVQQRIRTRHDSAAVQSEYNPMAARSDPDLPMAVRHPSGLGVTMGSSPSGHQAGGRSRAERGVSESATKQRILVKEEGKPPITYQLGECIGRGQFGSVYRALNLNSGRMLAVKRIRLQDKTEEEVSELAKEVELLKSLSHPSVVRYEGLVRTQHYLNIILEYVENGSLLHTLKAFGNLPEGLVASYVLKILEGLIYLHSQDVVHCDLKAANILTTKNGNIKLSDFGVSLNLKAVQDQNNVSGTPNWMAPEVIELKGASKASDIWSLACTIIELLTGKPPYGDLIAMSAMFRIVEEKCPPIPTTVSADLRDFLTLCFAKDPEDRPTAQFLFDHHVWLKRNWDPQKDLRPQDSVPFMKRISTEMRRLDLDTFKEVPEGERSDTGGGSRYLSTSPDAFHLNNSSETVQRNKRTPPNLSVSLPDALSSTSPISQALDASALASEIDLVGVGGTHSFIKSTFSKPVECKICRSFVKRHASLCENCGLICHSTCTEFAPAVCNLRAQLLMFGRDQPPTPMADQGVLPTSAPFAPSASAPPPSGARWSLGLGARKLRTSFSSSYGANSAWSHSGADLSASAPQASTSVLGTSPPSPSRTKRMPDIMRSRSRTRSPEPRARRDSSSWRPTPPGSTRSGSGSHHTGLSGSVNSNLVDASRVHDMDDDDSVIDLRSSQSPRFQRGASDFSTGEPASAPPDQTTSDTNGRPEMGGRYPSGGFSFLQSPGKAAKRMSRIAKVGKDKGHDRRESAPAECTIS